MPVVYVYGFERPIEKKREIVKGITEATCKAYDVPPEIVDSRQKIGFVTPIARWFRDEAETTVDPVLRSEACRRRGLFDPAALEAALARHQAGRLDLSNNIYRWILTELWFQEFIDGPPPPR